MAKYLFVYHGGKKPETFIALLRKLPECEQRPISLVVDRHPTHMGAPRSRSSSAPRTGVSNCIFFRPILRS